MWGRKNNSNDNSLPSTSIVSNIMTTTGGRQAWVEQDGKGRLYVRCGCGLYAPKPALAPALGALVQHVEACR